MGVQIQHDEAEGRGALRAFEGDVVLGSTVYVRSAPDVVLVQHTGVESAARGKGVGTALFEALVEWARSTGNRVSVSCPYMARQFREHPEARDVLR